MTKTLAEMTPEERAECVGMWCETTYGMAQGMRLFCGEGRDELMHRGIVAKMIRPNQEGFGFVPFSDVTPRFDLPRAWNPDGTPPAGKWETRAKNIGGLYTLKDTTRTRWVGEWEPTQ